MRTWKLAERDLDLTRPIGAGIVNVTVDSMFEGARSGTPEQAVRDGLALAEAGFEMLDVGAVAANAGPPVPPEEEAAALVPAVEGLVAELRGSLRTYTDRKEPQNEVPVSADTFSPEVARRAIAGGARVVNDISGGCEEMFELVAETGCGYVLMHIEGPPRVDRPWRSYDDVVDHLRAWFEGRVEVARDLGVAEEQIAIDPGLDFDLSPDQDLEILRRLENGRSLMYYAGWAGQDKPEEFALAASAFRLVAGQALVPTIVAKREGILVRSRYDAPRGRQPFSTTPPPVAAEQRETVSV